MDFTSAEDADVRREIPAWKLEIIKNRKKHIMMKTSASFSSYDHSSRRDEMSRDARDENIDSAVKTKDIIKRFNQTTDGTRVSLSSSQSFSVGQRRQSVIAAEIRSREYHHQAGAGDSGMWCRETVGHRQVHTRSHCISGELEESGVWTQDVSQCDAGPAAARHTLQSALSRSLTHNSDRSVHHQQQHQHHHHQGGRGERAGGVSRSVSFSVIRDHRSDDSEDDDDVSLGQDTGDNNRYLPTLHPRPASSVSAGVIMFDQKMGEDTRLYISSGPGERSGRAGAGGARLYRDRRQRGRCADTGDSDGMMGSGGESDSSTEEIHYGPGFVSRYTQVHILSQNY